jgi:endogenous inhibitor of DNA gyrase (YacG/DUF329 family)
MSATVREPRCPSCGRPRQQRFRPFCSATCRDRDLLAWLDGRYRVPAVEDADPEDGPESTSDPDGNRSRSR